MTDLSQALHIEPDLIQRFNRNGPRYTSYPTADRFTEGFRPEQYVAALERRRALPSSPPWSLYFHLPFCSNICYYCGCNKIITKDHGRSAKYIRYLAREIALQTALAGDRRDVVQLHWGGGTPTFLDPGEMRELMRITRESFDLAPDGEYSIEIDPRRVDEPVVALLAELGFNRMSLGVQDFDPQVQRAVNRVQSEEETRAVMDAARRHGFRSISVDLIYGLPKQSLASFDVTLDKIIDASPDRLSVYNYAHLPNVFKPQRRILEADLPSPEEKIAILTRSIERLTGAGYVYIGMDHFAKPDDELAIAQREGRLHRNFQGYSTYGGCDLMGLGISAIGSVGRVYAQNVRTLDEYYGALDEGRLAVFRGIELDADDLLRREVISALMCDFAVDAVALSTRHGIDFWRYFETEIADLDVFVAADLVRTDPSGLSVTRRGRLVIRNIAMVFDRYLRSGATQARYSKLV